MDEWNKACLKYMFKRFLHHIIDHIILFIYYRSYTLLFHDIKYLISIMWVCRFPSNRDVSARVCSFFNYASVRKRRGKVLKIG